MNQDIWNTFSSALRQRFGQRVQKIPLDCGDAGSTCPNRDGTLSHTGCVFCNPLGSGSGLGMGGLSLAGQWEQWRNHFLSAGRASLFLAYLQSFTNTYGPASRFAAVLDQLRPLPDMVGLCVGTRPDCMDAEKAALISSMNCPETWLELGVQSFHDATLVRINRGHTAAQSESAILNAHKARLKVCAHLIAGLPGESPEDFLHSVRRLNELPVQGVKFHNLYVCHHTPLEREYLAGRYTPLTQTQYIELMVEALHTVRPDMLIHRVAADPAEGELVAPLWALDKHLTQIAIEKALRAQNPALAKGAARQRAKAAQRAARTYPAGAPYTERRKLGD